MMAILRLLSITVPLAFIFYAKYLQLASSRIGDVWRYIEFFNEDSSIFSFEYTFNIVHYLIEAYGIDPILFFSVIGALTLSLIVTESRALIGSSSGSIGGILVLTVFAILPPESSLFSTFLSAWRFLYGFLFLVLGTLFLNGSGSRLARSLPYQLRNLMSLIFFILAAISHSATLILSSILIIIYFMGHSVDSLLSFLYRLKLQRSSFSRIKVSTIVISLISLLLISRLVLTDYFSARISHYYSFSSFEGSYFQVLFSVALSYAASLCLVFFSFGAILGPLLKSYSVLPVLIVPLLLISPASAYRLSSQYYFLGFICLVYILCAVFVRLYSWREVVPPGDSR